MIILNLKNYPESTGKNLAGVIADLQAAAQQEPRMAEHIFLAPAIYDLHMAVSLAGGVKVAAPHVDLKQTGSTTGWVPADSLLAMGVDMSVLNHSEHRFADWAVLEQLIIEAQAKGLKLIVCCENLEEAEKLLALKPYGIAFEDKDLIGSGQSITTAKAEDVKKFISMVKGKSKAIIGAGISTGEDVRSGIEFGADGFILASAFVKATDRKAKAIELVTPFLV